MAELLGINERSSDYRTITAREHETERRLNRMPVVSTLDSDAEAFLTAASITNPIHMDAVNDLVVAVKAASIWTKLHALYPFVGASAGTHKWNLKDPRDLDAAFRIDWQGSWTHNSDGITPDGSTAYANTFCSPGSILTTSSGSLGLYCRTSAAGGGQPYSFACDDGDVNPVCVIPRYSSGNYFLVYGSSSFVPNAASASAQGMWVTNRNGSVETEAWKNGVLLQSATHAVTLPNAARTLYLGANNRAGTATYFSAKNLALAFVADGLSSTEIGAFYTAVQDYQTTLGRNV